MSLNENLQKISARIAEAAKRSGRPPETIELVAVSKKQNNEIVSQYTELCLKKSTRAILGENYVQEYKNKKEIIGEHASHLIGPLQSNKAKEAVRLFDVIQSVHSLKIAEEINKQAGLIKKKQDIFMQVNISGDPAKSGFINDGNFFEAVRQISGFENLKLQGLMTITFDYDNPEAGRPDFKALRDLRDQIHSKLPEYNDLKLSMGMSSDFEIAIEEGADLVRVGTALFGERG